MVQIPRFVKFLQCEFQEESPPQLKLRLMKGSRQFLGHCIIRVVRMASDFSTS